MLVLPLLLSLLTAAEAEPPPAAPLQSAPLQQEQPEQAHKQVPVPPDERGFYLLKSARPEQAVSLAVALLKQDPQNIGAHRLYVLATSLGLREGPQVQATYKAWIQSNPQDKVAAVALAELLSHTHRTQGSWCDEMELLLDFETQEPDLAYYQLRSRFQARKVCPGDRESDRLRLSEGEGKQGRALRYSLWLRAQQGQFDARYLQDLQVLAAQGSWWLGAAGNPWAESAEGEHIQQIQSVLLQGAEEMAASQDPMQLDIATQIYRLAQDPRAKETRSRQLALDPDWSDSLFSGNGAVRWIEQPSPKGTLEAELVQARYSSDSQRKAIQALAALEPQIPEEGPDRALFSRYYSDSLDSTIRFRAARQARLTAWEHNPQNYWVVKELTWNCGTWGEDLEQGLQAATQYIEHPRRYAARGPDHTKSLDEWRLQELTRLAVIHDNRGLIYLELEQPEQAEADFRRSILLNPTPMASPHLHLGVMLAESGQDEEALLHLARGLALGEPEWPNETREASKLAEELYEEMRYSPGGFEAWVASNAPKAQTRSGTQSGTQLGAQSSSYRVGQSFPDLALSVDGQERTLSSYPGLRVIDVWATWCGPCITGLPELSELAEQYEGEVTVLAVSIDQDLSEVEAFREGPKRPDYTVAWTGESGWEQMKISSIPSVFLIDAEGTIVYHGRSEQALRQAIEQALQESSD